MKTQTILVTGGGGYIGSHMVKMLLLAGFKVVVFDNFYRGFEEPLMILKRYGDLKVVFGDLVKKEEIKQVFEKYPIDAVMHFAALCLVDESMNAPELYFNNNVLGTLNLLEAMKEFGVGEVIFSSTCAVYGVAEYVPIDEDHPTNPESPYGESKLMAERIIEWFGRVYGFKYAILRYFNVCGADEDGEIGDSKKPSQLLVQNAVRGALGLERFELTCPKVDTLDGTPIRDYVSVVDVTKAHLLALEYINQGGVSSIFNIGSGNGWSVREILEVVKKELGKEFEITSSAKPRRGEYAKVYANIKKAKRSLNWQPEKALSHCIQSLKRWYEKKPNGYTK